MKHMIATGQLILVLLLAFSIIVPWRIAKAQVSPPSAQYRASQALPPQTSPVLLDEKGQPSNDAAPSRYLPSAPLPRELLLEFHDAGTKFDVEALMKILRDSRHEGWVLAAYPDPKTSRPLIGAGFSLDVEEREHIQTDPSNPHTFLEPSSAQLWQAAGLDADLLPKILAQFDRNLQKWNKKGYRKKIKANKLPPDVTNAEATALLRVSALQAIHNAKAYCRDYVQLTASQQMALSQLVFQMGVNLEEFVQFLSVLNSTFSVEGMALANQSLDDQSAHWKAVQQTLIDSQWARRYTSRAVSVIAMFDLNYSEHPRAAEQQVQAVLRPPPKHHRKKPRADSV